MNIAVQMASNVFNIYRLRQIITKNILLTIK